MNRKNNIFALVCCIAAISIGFSSCNGVEWDREDSLKGMSHEWAHIYLSEVIDDYDDYYYVAGNAKINDTIAFEKVFACMDGKDSVNVTTTITLIDSVMTATTDGYRYADNLTAHIFTVDPGIVDKIGKLHIDFYQTDGMTPWAWTEVTFSKDNWYKFYRRYEFEDVTVGWY